MSNGQMLIWAGMFWGPFAAIVAFATGAVAWKWAERISDAFWRKRIDENRDLEMRTRRMEVSATEERFAKCLSENKDFVGCVRCGRSRLEAFSRKIGDKIKWLCDCGHRYETK